MDKAKPASVVLTVNGTTCTFAYRDAEIFAEQLLNLHREHYMGDVNLLAGPSGGSTDPGWLEGCESLAHRIEAVLTTAASGPIVIDARGKEGDAAFHALRLSAPVSFDANSDRARFFRALEAARQTPPPSGLGALLRRLLGS